MGKNMDFKKLMNNKEVMKASNFFVKLNGYYHKFTKEDWHNVDIKKYYIGFDCETDTFYVDFAVLDRVIGCNYFKTEEKALEVLNKYQVDMKKYYLNFKD